MSGKPMRDSSLPAANEWSAQAQWYLSANCSASWVRWRRRSI